MTQLHTLEAQAKRQASRHAAKNVVEMVENAHLGLPPTVEAEVVQRLDSMPERYRRTYLRAMRGRSKSAAIKAFCLECVMWQKKEVALCTDQACPLYPYRPFGRE